MNRKIYFTKWIFGLTRNDSDAIITKHSKFKCARVVELADSLDSGSSVHFGRAGSTPASRTITVKVIDTIVSVTLTFFYDQKRL